MDSKLAVPVTDQQYESEASEGYDVPPPAYRGDSESSTERSLYDEKDEALFTNQPTSSHVREYGFYHPKLAARGFVITDNDASTETSKVSLYYIEVSEFALKKPDVIFHQLPPTSGMADLEHFANTGESAPIIGVAHFPKFSQQIKAGLGDPSSSAGMTYVEVQNPNKLSHGEYRMSLNGKSYAWKRTHEASAGLEGSSIVRKLNRSSFQLFDLSTNKVIAVFLHNMYKGWKKIGKLRIFKDLEGGVEMQQLKLLVFLSISAIMDKARRRRNRSRNHGGGGGP